MHWVQTVDLEEKAKPCKQNLQTTEATVFCSWYLPLLHVVQVVVGVAKEVPAVQKRHLIIASCFTALVPWSTKYRPDGHSEQLTEAIVF